MDKPWYDDLRAIGSQIKAGYSEDLTGNTGQAMKAFSPKDSAVYQKGQELVDEAADTTKENASDYEGRGAIAKPLIHAARFLSGAIAPLVASAPLMVSPFAQAVTLGLLYGGSAGQKTYERVRDTEASENKAVTSGLVAALANSAAGALSTPAAFGGLHNITPGGSATITRAVAQSAERAADRGFAKLVNTSGLATRKYDKFAANKANAVDQLKTVSEQGGLKAIPPTAESSDKSFTIKMFQDLWRQMGKSEPEIESATAQWFDKQSRGAFPVI